MDRIYLEIYSISELCIAPIETIVALFLIKYCRSKIGIKLVHGELKENERPYSIDISDLVYEILDRDEMPHSASTCQLPNITANVKGSCIAGLCAILRQIIKSQIGEQPAHDCRSLLGFKESCLLTCSEASVWTRFCEVDVIATLKFLSEDTASNYTLPDSVARFECYMSEPIRLHNLYKHVQSKTCQNKKLSFEDVKTLPEHIYAEESTITLGMTE